MPARAGIVTFSRLGVLNSNWWGFEQKDAKVAKVGEAGVSGPVDEVNGLREVGAG
jgi:hypothetical protein